ncbi:MAG TPA: ABC transporter permease [Kofleriaceae bacterium]|jgi:peptide/nickel transport system permease protein|nr:ABC transporter permease [Kofleriaceae bacterium]
MIRFVIRRLLLTIPVLLGIILIVFVVARVIPGDPCRAALGERATVTICNDFNARFGLNKPIVPGLYKVGQRFEFRADEVAPTLLDNQFTGYISQLARGDLGTSIRFGRPVGDLLMERLPLTVELTIVALLFAILVGVPLGIISAYRRNSKIDVTTMVFANLGVSIPVFVLGLVLAYLFAVTLKDTPFALPPSGRTAAGVAITPLAVRWGLEGLQGPLRGILDFVSNMYTLNFLFSFEFGKLIDALRHLILPAIALGTIPLAIIARITRSSLLEVLGLDYVRTAHAKGLGRRLVMVRHAMRNAMLPVVTVIGLQLGGLLSGAVLTESIFNLVGLGRTVVEAIEGRDYIIVQAVTLVVAVIYVAVNLIVDISYGLLDPRVRVH